MSPGESDQREGRFGYPMVSLYSKYVLLPEFLAVSTGNYQPQRGDLSSARNIVLDVKHYKITLKYVQYKVL